MIVGYKLRREVRDWLVGGPDLTAGERIVLLEIADNANDESRIAYPGMDELERMTGMSRVTISKLLQRMASKGLEIRVPVSVGSDGRAVFAAKGHQTTYRIPDSTKPGPSSALSGAHSPDGGPGNQAAKGGQSSRKGQTVVPQRADGGPLKGGPWSGPSPQGTLKEPSFISSETPSFAPLTSSSATTLDDARKKKIKNTAGSKAPTAAATLIAHTDIQAHEIGPFVHWFREQYPNIRNAGLYIAGCTPDSSLDDRLEEARNHWEAVTLNVWHVLNGTGHHANGRSDAIADKIWRAAYAGYDATAITDAMLHYSEHTASPIDGWEVALDDLLDPDTHLVGNI